MTPERWQRIKTLFDEALPLGNEERRAHLLESSGADNETIQEVLRLLDRSESAGSFLEQPVGDARRILSDAERDAQPALAVGQQLGGRFVIERFIAHGGMGEVYRAFDRELGIPVAIKTLRREFSRNGEFVERFRREVQVAREVHGDHLCRMYDIGRDGTGDDSLVYLSMEFLDGPTLREILKQNAPLPTETALPILEDIASGLESLRRRGMVHRDLKPGNIVLVDWGTPQSRAVITDFGLARSAFRQRGGSASGHSVTTMPAPSQPSGRLAGTPDYMAPEQLNGKPVGPATDLYAFGIVAYEMVTGQRPFGGEGWESAFLRLTDDPASPRSHSSTLPLVWERAILQCLARNPEDRPASAALVTEVLRGRQPMRALQTGAVRRIARKIGPWQAVAVLLFALAAAGVGWRLAPRSNQTAADQPVQAPGKHIAVLPFSYSETDPSLRAYADGLMDTITRRLSQFEQDDSQLLVVPSSEVRSHKVESPADALRRFQAQYAIEGRVDSQDDRVRLTLTVVDTSTMRQLQTAVIEEPRDRLLNLQDGAIARLSYALSLRGVTPEQVSMDAGLRISPAAYDFYLQGRGYLQRNDRTEDVRNAIQLFERALSIDKSYAPALAGLADAQWYLFERTRDPQWVAKARDSAAAALRIHPQLADAYITMGRLQAGTGDAESAVRSFQQALSLDARNLEALSGLGSAYAALKQFPAAESTYLRAVSYRPSDWNAHKKLGVFYLNTGEDAKAIAPLQHVVELTPDNAQGYNNLGVAYTRTGRFAEARKALERSLALDRRISAITNLASLEFLAGNYAKSAEWCREALQLEERGYRVWGNLAAAYEKLNQPEEARRSYEKAVAILEDELRVNPRSGTLLSSLAHYQASLGMRDQAVANMRSSVQLEPRDPDLWHRNAETWAALGDMDEALQALRTAVSLGFLPQRIPPHSRLAPLRAKL
jgi:serine/threonine-protein kinase